MSADRIALTGIRAVGFHGVYEHERREGQGFVADVELELSLARAAATDDVAERVAGVLTGEPVDLLETLAQRIVDVAFAFPLVDAVTVTVHKPQAPIAVAFGDVSVTIHRRREELR